MKNLVVAAFVSYTVCVVCMAYLMTSIYAEAQSRLASCERID